MHPVDQACLRAERASVHARLGQLDLAREEIAELQALFDRQPSAAVTAWTFFADACVRYYASLSSAARDRMQRAHALSAAAQLPRIRALSAAWLAHMDYAQLDFEAAAAHVVEALRLCDGAHGGDRAALSRACLVVAVALHFAERDDLAQPWYVRARAEASTDGDEATLQAIAHNIAWLRSHHAVQASVFGDNAPAFVRRALAGAEAADNFAGWLGGSALDSMVPMQRAGALSALGECAQALALYDRHWQEARRQGLGRLSATFLADMAWCRWRCADREGALRDAAAAAAAIDPAMHPDDLAVAHARIAQVLRAAGQTDPALDHEGRSRDCWARHRRTQADLLALFGRLTLPA